MNLKIRVQNPAWWITLAVGIAVMVGGYFGIQATDITTWKIFTDTLGAAIANPYVVISIVIYILASLFDFSTLNFGDSLITKAKISIGQTAEDIIKEQFTKEQEEAKEAAVTNAVNTVNTESTESDPETAATPETTMAAPTPTLTAEQASAVISQISGMVATGTVVQ